MFGLSVIVDDGGLSERGSELAPIAEWLIAMNE